MNDESTAADPSGIDELCKQVTGLMEAAEGPLKRVRVQAGDLLVEVEWPAPDAAPNGQPAQNGQLVTAGHVVGNGRHVLADQVVAVGQAALVAALEPSGPGGSQAPPPDEGLFVVHAPLVGTFFRSPSPGARPFAEVGDTVEAGQQVAIVEAMKLMNAVEADQPGRVVEVLVADGRPVEYGEALFVLAPLE